MISNKFKKKAIVLAIAIFIMLIIPTSFAGENIGINQTQELSLNDEATTDDASQIYVDANSGKSNGTGSADDPVQTISQGLNLSKSGGTIYLTGEFTGE